MLILRQLPRFWGDRASGQQVYRKAGLRPCYLPFDLTPFFDNDAISAHGSRDDGNFDCPDHPPSLPGSGYPAERMPKGGAVFAPTPGSDTLLFPVIAGEELQQSIPPPYADAELSLMVQLVIAGEEEA